MSYEIEHSVEIRFTGIPKLQTEETLQLWVPTPKGVVAEFSLNPTSSIELDDVGCTINYWAGLPLENTLITCFYEHSGVARVPPTSDQFMKSALALNEPLSKVTEGLRKLKVLRDAEGLSLTKKISAIKNFLIKHISYEYPPKTREAIEVLEIGRTDCGGYHATFVALSRSLGIPAVLDFGYRTNQSDSPHVWAWWFNQQTRTWILEDLNDEQERRVRTDRVSITHSTNPQLNPPYPLPVIFLQSHLTWIQDITSLKDRGLNYEHGSSYVVAPKT